MSHRIGPEEAKLREEICVLSASLFNRGYGCGASGNVSVLTEAGMIVSPTGSSMGRLDPERLSLVAPDGTHLAGDRPSKEAFLHLAMYEERPEMRSVVHLHSTHSVALSCLEEIDPEDVLPPITAYYVMRVGRCPLVPYFAPGDRALAEAVRGVARHAHAMLLANHGPVVAGKGLDAAVAAAEELEETAKLYLMLRGEKTRFLTQAQVADLRLRFPS
ncbi:aldolase [Paralimibaculum aggregatum]|uniref:3-oxo-tetronate 4-phosphate decarboxylase n=1 Tax=Paralimibaculum aggregatum TaxID=3036245 RepID=A0ABQ6LS58_9RHOB|nr:3-oxo-tetronate 4-phosphate decarboxylase [Limibaculum sp. NKW23]GMG84606.1 aldolase [Limibaculum sp. NKW23]